MLSRLSNDRNSADLNLTELQQGHSRRIQSRCGTQVFPRKSHIVGENEEGGVASPLKKRLHGPRVIAGRQDHRASSKEGIVAAPYVQRNGVFRRADLFQGIEVFPCRRIPQLEFRPQALFHILCILIRLKIASDVEAMSRLLVRQRRQKRPVIFVGLLNGGRAKHEAGSSDKRPLLAGNRANQAVLQVKFANWR